LSQLDNAARGKRPVFIPLPCYRDEPC
jgi:hypothetical protein